MLGSPLAVSIALARQSPPAGEKPMTDLPECDAELDASGLNCPLPLLKAKLQLNQLASGAVLKVIATDAGSQRDFRTFARLSGNLLLQEKAEAGVYRYWLQKA
jgi:TusA-related sulfurtransferase